MTDATTKAFLKRCADDRDLLKQFIDNPVGTLKANNIDPNDLPKEVADKIAGGGAGTDTVAAVAAGACL